jgi:hypothetical protein
MVVFSPAGLLGLRKQLAPYKNAPDFTGAGANFIPLGIATNARADSRVDVAIAAKNLDALAGHPGGFFSAPQNNRSRPWRKKLASMRSNRLDLPGSERSDWIGFMS